jgi:hypothetical protein
MSLKIIQTINYHLNCLKELKTENTDSLKVSLWLIASISKSQEGFKWLSNQDLNLVALFDRISNNHDDFDVRKTALYCLSLLKNDDKPNF